MKYCAFFLVCVVALAQPAPPNPPRRAATNATGTTTADAPAPAVRPEDKCTVEGNVVNGSTGEALKKARVSMRPVGTPNGIPYGATTDGAGHFLIDDIDPGRYAFSVSRTGYVSQQYSPQGNARQGTTLTLANAQKMKDVNFKLTPQGVVAGRILDEDGEPMANVNVQLAVYGYQRGKKQLLGRNGTSTDDRGEFRIHGLSPGKYVLSATYQSPDMFMAMANRASNDAVPDEGYATTYYPNSTSLQNASQLTITPGSQVTGINMSLARVRTVRVKGHVNGVTSGTQGRRNMIVMLMNRDPGGGFNPRSMSRVTDAQGNFQLRGVVPGSYILRADYAADNQRFSAHQPLEVGNSNIDNIEVNLLPPVELKGKVVVEDNGSLAGTRPAIMLQAKVPGGMGGGGRVQYQDDTTFLMNNVSPDAYDIVVQNLPDGYYLKSVKMGQQDITETGVDFSTGGAGEITVVLNPNGGQIDGTVKNDKGDPAPNASVTLIPDEEHRSLMWLYKTGSTDQSGHFTFKGLRPGKYTVYAWEDIEQGAYQDPDFVKPFEASGEKLNLSEGTHSTVQLKVVPAEKTGEQSGR